jgi:maleate isomerase
MSEDLKKVASLKELKRIGFLTPSSNAALEPLTMAMLAQLQSRVSVHFTRTPVVSLTLNAKDVNQFQKTQMADAAALLNDAQMDAILWNGTSGSWTGRGLAADVELCNEITGRTGVQASTSSLAQMDVLKKYRIETVGLAVPYVKEPTERIVDTYQRSGYAVVKTARLEETQNTVIGNTPRERIKQLLRDADSREADCIVVACTNLAAATCLDEMEFELGKPIFDSVAVTLWKALRMIGIEVPIHGWGKLLRENETVAEFEAITQELLEVTGASRTTLRLDIPEYNCHVDTVCAEAVKPGVRPLKLDSSLNQRSLATVRWLEANRRMLIQDDCANAETPPPAALMGVYGVKAQMLSPLTVEGYVLGWLSVHHIAATRIWKDHDITALQRATDKLRHVLERSGLLRLPR